MGKKEKIPDEDEDIFVRGGLRNHVSMYAKLSGALVDSSSDSDDDSEIKEIGVKESLNELERRAARTTKRRRHDILNNGSDQKRKKTEPKDVKDVENANTQAEEHVISVFQEEGSSDDDDEIQFVSTNFKPPSSSSRTLRKGRERPSKSGNGAIETLGDDVECNTGRELLERIRQSSQLADEDRIVREAQQQTQMEMDLKEQQRRAEEQRRRAEEQRNRVLIGEEAGKYITLKIRLGGNTMPVKIRMKNKLLSARTVFCKKFNQDESSLKMEVDGEIVQDGDTPEDYDLDDNMVVDLIKSK